jgi:hypothetical protein
MSDSVIRLSDDERDCLIDIVGQGRKKTVRSVLAKALLWLDCSAKGPGLTDKYIKDNLGLSLKTLTNLKVVYRQYGALKAVDYRPPEGECLSGRLVRLEESYEDKLIALASSAAPAGHKRWSVRLLTEKAVQNNIIPSVSHMTVHRVLKKYNLQL